MMLVRAMHEGVGNAGMSGGGGEGGSGGGVVVVVCEGRVERAGEAGTCLTACSNKSRVAQWQRVGPITQRSLVRIQALLSMQCDAACTENHASCDGNTPPSKQHTPFIPLDSRSYWDDAGVRDARGSGQCGHEWWWW